MTRAAPTLLVLALLLGSLPDRAAAGVNKTGWYFPIPYTLSSPQSPHRFGGAELGFATSDAGYAITFPLISNLTDRANRFIIEMGLPLAVGVPDTGPNKFYLGSPKLGLRGTWKFNFPFAEGNVFPAAWSVGADLSIPLAAIWGDNAASRLATPVYPYDPVGWVPHWGFRPKAELAIGKPIFFTEMELTLGNLIYFDGPEDYGFLLGWGLALGTMPIDLVSLTLEFGGVHDLTDSVFPVGKSAIWGALGSRFYFGQFVTGLCIRLPFTRAYAMGDASAGFTDADPSVNILVFVGYEHRHAKPF